MSRVDLHILCGKSSFPCDDQRLRDFDYSNVGQWGNKFTETETASNNIAIYCLFSNNSDITHRSPMSIPGASYGVM